MGVQGGGHRIATVVDQNPDIVVRRADSQGGPVAAAFTLDQHLDLATHMALMEGESTLLTELNQLTRTIRLDLAWGMVRQALGRRAFPQGVGEGVQVGHWQAVQQFQGVAELGLGLARKANHDICAETRIGNGCGQLQDSIGVVVAIVAATHAAQYVIVATLEGDVVVSTESC